MLLRKEVSHATDLELLTAIIGNRRTATQLFEKAKFSLFALLHSMPQQNGDLFCAEGSSVYASDPMTKLRAVHELAARALAEDLRTRDCLTSPVAVRDLLRHKLAGLPHEVFVCIQLDAQHRVIAIEELFRGTLTQTSVYLWDAPKNAPKPPGFQETSLDAVGTTRTDGLVEWRRIELPTFALRTRRSPS